MLGVSNRISAGLLGGGGCETSAAILQVALACKE